MGERGSKSPFQSLAMFILTAVGIKWYCLHFYHTHSLLDPGSKLCSVLKGDGCLVKIKSVWECSQLEGAVCKPWKLLICQRICPLSELCDVAFTDNMLIECFSIHKRFSIYGLIGSHFLISLLTLIFTSSCYLIKVLETSKSYTTFCLIVCLIKLFN